MNSYMYYFLIYPVNKWYIVGSSSNLLFPAISSVFSEIGVMITEYHATKRFICLFPHIQASLKEKESGNDCYQKP